MINFPTDKSVVLSKEGSLAHSKSTWGQVLTPTQGQADWASAAWPRPGPGPARPTCPPHRSPQGSLVTNMSVSARCDTVRSGGCRSQASSRGVDMAHQQPDRNGDIARFSYFGEKAVYLFCFVFSLNVNTGESLLHLYVIPSTLPALDFRLMVCTP